MRKTISVIGTFGGIGLFLLRYAAEISNYVGIFSLPGDLKDALIVLSNIPTVIAWGVLSVGLFCAAYLVVDSDHHTLALTTFKKRVPRLDPLHLIIGGLIIALAGVCWHLYRSGGSLSLVQRVETSQTVTVTPNVIRAPPPEVVANIKAPFEAEIVSLKQQLAEAQKPKTPTTKLANVEAPTGPPKPTRYFSKLERERIGGLIAEMRRALNGDGKQAIREISLVGQIEPGMSKDNLQSNIDRMHAAREKLNGVYKIVYHQIIAAPDNADIRDELDMLTGPANTLLDLNTAADYRGRAISGILEGFDQLNSETRTIIMMGLGTGGNELRRQAEQANNWIDSSVRNIDLLNQQLAQQ